MEREWGILISYLPCLHRGAYSLTRRKNLGGEKICINLLPPLWLAIRGKTTYLTSELGWRNGTWGEQTFIFLSQCLESRMHTFSSSFRSRLFVPKESLQLGSSGWTHSILVEGINKPKWVHSTKSLSSPPL